ncbi:MAG: hypothetical protein H7A52_15705 [Akkermansiaceae bacterium]|nr:hypothetical protein [Akkermansiaceae bacterium]
MKTTLFSTLCLAAILSSVSAADGPSVTLVTDPNAAPLETHAAKELTGLLTTLFDARVTIAKGNPPEGATRVIRLGAAQSAGALTADLGQQGHVVKSTPSGLVIAGNSPVATLWAVYEYGYANGMRYLTGGDFPPREKPAFTLDGFDIVRTPRHATRAWRVRANGPASQAAWTVADHEILLRQLAKLAFNAVILPGKDEPIAFEPIDVTGDIAGRSVFGGAKSFANPDLEGDPGAAEKWLAGIRDAAGALGLTSDPAPAAAATISLGQPQGGLLPQTAPVVLPAGDFAVEAAIVGDFNPELHYLSRAAWDDSVTPESALRDLATPICGEGVAETLALGFAAVAEVSALIEKADSAFAVPDPKMFMEHYAGAEPAPEWWAKGKELYGKAVGEMYRANTRARDGARPWILHHAKRYTFALHYLTAVEAARNAAIARAAKDDDAWAENLEAAVEAMHNALGIHSEVAADPSDRGAIALLNDFAYRPLLEALDELP